MSFSRCAHARHARRRTDEALSHARRTLRDDGARLSFDALALSARRRSWLSFPPLIERHRHHGVEVITHLARFAHAFRNSPTDWSPETNSPWAFVSSLANHVFGREDIPLFLSRLWYGRLETSRDADRQRQWFIDFAAGKKWRHFDTPIAMTRRMEHTFLQTPSRYGVVEAMRRAEVIMLGAEPPLVDAVLSTRLREPQSDEAFWRSVLHFLVREQECLSTSNVRRIVAFIHAVRHEPITLLDGEDELAPLRPDFAMKGRSLAALLRDVEAWEVAIGHTESIDWSPSQQHPMVFESSTPSDGAPAQRWIITELRTAGELYEEGRRMRHCVGSYSRACRRGSSRIWSLRRLNHDGTWHPLVTFEVDPRGWTVEAINAFANSDPSAGHRVMIERWAERERVEITPYA